MFLKIFPASGYQTFSERRSERRTQFHERDVSAGHFSNHERKKNAARFSLEKRRMSAENKLNKTEKRFSLQARDETLNKTISEAKHTPNSKQTPTSNCFELISINFYPFRSILTHFDPFQSISTHFDQFRSILSYFDPF